MGLSRSNNNNIKNQWLAVLFLAIPGLAFSATPAINRDFADERWFEVELIIFAHTNKEALESEDWPTITGLSLPEEIVELSFPTPEPAEEEIPVPDIKEPALKFGPVTHPSANGSVLEQGDSSSEPIPMPVAFEMLPEKDLQLKDTFKKLTRSSRFEPLVHVAWRQPTFGKKHAQTVLLYEGMTEPVPGFTDNEGTVVTRNKMPGEETKIGPLNPRVIGTVRLSVARYLHLAADLFYRAPVSERLAIPLSDLDLWYDKPYPTLFQHQGPAYRLKQWNVIHGFHLEESRRMRSKKVHYLDHPFFGVVVLVTPVELPKDPEEASIPDPSRNISSPR